MADENTNVNPAPEGENGAQGAPMAQPASNPTPAVPTPPAPAQAAQQQSNLRTFTQEQLDAIIARERSKAVKGWFSAEQMAAKDTTIQTLTGERDTARAEKDKIQSELDNYKHEKFLSSKGVPTDMVEFYAFKIGKLVTDKKTFEEAAEEYIKDNPPSGTVRMSTGGSVGGGNDSKPDFNAQMNAIIRGQK